MHALSLALLVAAAQAGSAEPAAPAAAPAAAAPVLSSAAIEKMGQGDRAFLERDYRSALFAYLDASYLAPASAVPRVKLARAYLALRHPARALDQAEKALAIEPGNADARKLADESRTAAAAQPPAPAAQPPRAPAAAASARVFKFAAEPAAAAPAAPPVPAAAAPRVVAAALPASPPAPLPAAAAAAPAPDAAPVQPLGGWGAQKYRQGLDHLRDRDFDKAVAVLTEAVTLDPRLAVAYAARASARFALGAYRESADDYRRAIDLDARLGTPLYGLAECHRVLGQRAEAAEMYRRYAESNASDVRDDLRALAAKRAAELR